MGWYSQGTQVVDFIENADGTIDFKEAGWFIPPTRTSGCRTSSRCGRTRTARSRTGEPPATSTWARAAAAIDVYKVRSGAAEAAGHEGREGKPG